MSDELKELRERIDKLSDKELSQMVNIDFSQYRKEALDYAKAEMNRRAKVKRRGLPEATIIIDENDDLEMIRMKNLNVVVDPMVFRNGDVFLRGSKGLAQSPELKRPETMWSPSPRSVVRLALRRK
jgi:hypothetical protein